MTTQTLESAIRNQIGENAKNGITQIKSIDDVKQFARQLIDEGLNFHPDDDFRDYLFNTTKEPYYSEEEAMVRNALMDQCFEVCDREKVDIYDTMLEEFLKGTGLDKYVPLPSTGQTITDLGHNKINTMYLHKESTVIIADIDKRQIPKDVQDFFANNVTFKDQVLQEDIWIRNFSFS